MFSFTVTPTINIIFDDQESRPKKSVKVPGQDPLLVPLYTGQENVSGVVDISLPPGKKIEHQGIRMELIGQTGERPSHRIASCSVNFLHPFCHKHITLLHTPIFPSYIATHLYTLTHSRT